MRLRRTRHRVDDYWQRRDLLAMQAMAPLGGQFFPMTEWSLRPAALMLVLNEIFVHQRVSVLECGSGNSTLAIARLLRRTGGRIVSLEDDERWADAVDRAIADEGLREHAAVVHAPLAPFSSELGEAAPWYDADAVRQHLPDAAVDLLLVDGPSSVLSAEGTARFPAVPVVRDHLADDYTIVLDDANRPGEKEVAAAWSRMLGVDFDLIWRIGVTIGRSRAAPPMTL
jgi:hypothetical protein